MSRAALLAVAATLLAAPLAACGDDDGGPFDKLMLDGTFSVDLESPVHVARDEFGVAHIHGKHLADVAFVQGYVMAHDRLPQMDVLRRFGAGTLSEIFGALDPSVIDTDLEMRMHRMKPLAEETLAQLRASGDPTDRDIVALLERFADGVNRYADDVKAGKWELDPNILVSFDPERFAAWSPVDSLVLGRFQAFSLSFSAPAEIEMTQIYQALRQAFPTGPRAGVPSDILTFKPVGLAPTIHDFPNGDTTSDGNPPDAARTAPHAPALDSVRPALPPDVYRAARTAFARSIFTGAHGALGPHAFMRPYSGSNNWAVGPELAGGAAILASDQHLQLPNPSIFYPTHLIVDDGDDEREPSELDVIGVTFPGIPGVILGSNGKLAWAATVSEHDVNDTYLETLTPCTGGGTACVRFNGQAVPIETFTEEIRIGALGTPTGSFTATYEVVPHHGPVIPEIDRTNHRIVPRPATRPPLTIKFTGYDPTFEIRALVRLTRATTVLEGFQALSDFSFGSQNWTMVDSTADIGWTTNAVVPLRSPATYQWNAQLRPNAAAPFFVLSGEGGFEWQGRMSNRHVPHAMTPIPTGGSGPQHYLATANSDPVGATFDNDPLNQTVVDGRPLYAGVTYAAGVREERITDVIVTDPDQVTREDMERLQHDSRSNVGAHLVPYILNALGYVATPVPAGAPPDVAPFIAGLAAADRDRLVTVRTLFTGWTAYNTPAARDAAGASASTAILNAWMHFFIRATLEDEFSAIGFGPFDLGGNHVFRIVDQMLAPNTILSKSTATNEPILCDRFNTGPTDDSCTRLVLEALISAMKHLESPQGFGTTDPAQWEWGKMHHLTIRPLFPNNALNLPAPGETATGGFAKNGDTFNVNRSDAGFADLNFAQSADGPAQRFIAVARPGEPITVRWQIPGGVIYDSRSPHYRDLLDKYYLPETHFDAPFAIDEIVDRGETRWEFR